MLVQDMEKGHGIFPLLISTGCLILTISECPMCRLVAGKKEQMLQADPYGSCFEMVQMTFLSIGLQWISPSLVDTGSSDTGYDTSPVQPLKLGAHKDKTLLSQES